MRFLLSAFLLALLAGCTETPAPGHIFEIGQVEGSPIKIEAVSCEGAPVEQEKQKLFITCEEYTTDGLGTLMRTHKVFSGYGTYARKVTQPN